MLAKQRTALWELVSRTYWDQSQAESNQLEKECYRYLDKDLGDYSRLNILDIGAGFAGRRVIAFDFY